jgi:hypothetical protein
MLVPKQMNIYCCVVICDLVMYFIFFIGSDICSNFSCTVVKSHLGKNGVA